MARHTSERILDTSLAMFNAQGEPNVTTNHIADELGISPGNLYYHFRNKEEIIRALFEQQFAEQMPADETRRARDEITHDRSLPRFALRHAKA